MKGAGQSRATVFYEEYFLDGRAMDAGGLASVQISGEELLPQGGARPVQHYFARRLPVDLGTNRFDIVARDAAGNQTVQHLTVVRRRPEFLNAEYRLTLGLAPVTGAAGNAKADQVSRLLRGEMLKDPVRFHLLEREEGWDFILREQQLSASDLADPRSALKIGKMLPAEMLLMPAVRATDKGLTICARTVESGEGKYLFAEDVYTEDPDGDLDFKVEGLVMKIKQRFPLAEGRVVGVEGKNVPPPEPGLRPLCDRRRRVHSLRHAGAQFLHETADLARANDLPQASVDILIDGQPRVSVR